MDIKDIIKIKDKYKEVLFKFKGVVGIGIGNKKVKGRDTDILSIVINVIKKIPEKKLKNDEVIPKVLNGIPTDIQEVHKLKALKL